jgi:hypothetical protein
VRRDLAPSRLDMCRFAFAAADYIAPRRRRGCAAISQRGGGVEGGEVPHLRIVGYGRGLISRHRPACAFFLPRSYARGGEGCAWHRAEFRQKFARRNSQVVVARRRCTSRSVQTNWPLSPAAEQRGRAIERDRRGHAASTRYSKGTPARKIASAKTPSTATKAAAAPRPRRQRTEEPTFRAAKALNFGSRKKGPVQCLGSRVAAGENPSLRPQSKATTSRSWWVWASRRRDLPVGGEPADRQAIG